MQRIKSAIVLAVLLAGATHLQAKVRTDYDADADFSKYGTYSWLEGNPWPNPLIEQRLRAAVEERLDASGLRKVESGGDLLVATHLRANTEKRIDVDTFGYGYRRWRGWSRATVYVREIEVGTLMVDLAEGEAKELVWRGLATETIKPTREKNEKTLNKVLDKMFKDFPPK